MDTDMGERGISPVVGVSVLVGLTTLVVVSLLVVGAGAIDGARSSAQTQQVEHAMSEFSKSASDLASQDAQEAAVDVPEEQDGTASVNRSAGRVDVTLVGENGSRRTLLSEDLGVYRYELEDGTEVAYQGGGVWRARGGETTLVQAPEFHFRQRPQPTLTFPILRLAPGESLSTEAERLRVRERRAVYPGPGDENPMDGRNVYVDLESRYCEGWAEHVDDRTDGIVEEGCAESDATRRGQLRANLTVPDPLSVHPHLGVGMYAGDLIVADNGDYQINATIGAGDQISYGSDARVDHDGAQAEGVRPIREPHDEEIQRLVEQANASDWEAFCGGDEWNYSCEYEGGQTIYVDDMATGAAEVTFDLDGGDVTIVARGDATISDAVWKLENGSDHNVEVYFTDDVTFRNSEFGPDGGRDSLEPLSGSVEDPRPRAFVFYGRSDATIRLEDRFVLDGSISAPSNGTSNSSLIDVAGNDVNVVGSLYADEIDVRDASIKLYQPPRDGAGDVREIEAFAGKLPEVYYLHLEEVLLEVDR